MNNAQDSTLASSILKRYQEMLSLSQDMLNEAKKEDWDNLVELGEKRGLVVEMLKRVDTISWSLTDAQKKEKIIRDIMTIDAEVKILMQSELKNLQENISKIATGMKVKMAYESI